MQITFFDFSGIYTDEIVQAVSGQAGDGPVFVRRIGCGDIPGTRGYCDEDAERELCARMRAHEVKPRGIRFLDNGNYHYLSYLCSAPVEEDYTLVLIDHHPDMRAPAFGDILSCGSWVLRALQRQRNLKRVLLIGTDDRLYREELQAMEDTSLRARIRMISSEEELLREMGTAEPFYLSVDKDVLSEEALRTNWDQGGMLLPELCGILKALLYAGRIIGADICGAPEARDHAACRDNALADETILRTLLWEKGGFFYPENVDK